MGPKFSSVLWLQEYGTIADLFERLCPPKNERQFSADSRAVWQGFAASSTDRDREGKAAELAASVDIILLWECRLFLS